MITGLCEPEKAEEYNTMLKMLAPSTEQKHLRREWTSECECVCEPMCTLHVCAGLDDIRVTVS